MEASEHALAELRERYLRFASEEVGERSAVYNALARSIARDDDVLGFLLTLPAAKRQPNLLLAAVRHRSGLPADWPQFRHSLLSDADGVRSVMLARSTQTNEPARCAVLLPALAVLPQPLALIEVGASAGLCLLPDCYGYRYGAHAIDPDQAGTDPPVFACEASPGTPLPAAMPRIVWRAGLDLNPVDLADRSQVSWLETLVWPGQAERLAKLLAALRIAASRHPRIVKANLAGPALAALCRQAPPDATLVVFHTAVLAYVEDRSVRQAFERDVRSLSPYWLSNEAPGIVPGIRACAGSPRVRGRFLLSLNGSPLAWTDPHGAAIEWIGTTALSR